MNKQMTFGQFLKESRLKAKYGLRQFAREIGWQPSNLSNVEHGRVNAPQNKKALLAMAEVLGFDEGSIEWNTLFDLASKDNHKILPADVKDFVEGLEAIPVLFRTLKDHEISKSELEDIVEYIRKHYSK